MHFVTLAAAAVAAGGLFAPDRLANAMVRPCRGNRTSPRRISGFHTRI